MSVYAAFLQPNALDECDLRMIEAEAERVGTHIPFGSDSAPAPSPHLVNAFAVQHTFEWSTSMSPKTRTLDDLRAWVWREIANGSDAPLHTTDKVSLHLGVAGTIGVINARIDALLEGLNRAEGFAEDALSLQPGDVPSDPTVNQLLKAIVSDYERRDIEVIL